MYAGSDPFFYFWDFEAFLPLFDWGQPFICQDYHITNNAVGMFVEKDHEVVREEARDLMRQIQEKGVEYDSDRKVRPYLTVFISLPSYHTHVALLLSIDTILMIRYVRLLNNKLTTLALSH
jgi:hypothetical protein